MRNLYSRNISGRIKANTDGFRILLDLIPSEEHEADIQITIETSASISSSTEELLIDPTARAEAMKAIDALDEASVRGLTISSTGSLTIELDEERSLTINPDPDYEAWELRDSRIQLIALPGGGVAEFGQDATED